jgi:hypothetical protein
LDKSSTLLLWFNVTYNIVVQLASNAGIDTRKLTSMTALWTAFKVVTGSFGHSFKGDLPKEPASDWNDYNERYHFHKAPCRNIVPEGKHCNVCGRPSNVHEKPHSDCNSQMQPGDLYCPDCGLEAKWHKSNWKSRKLSSSSDEEIQLDAPEVRKGAGWLMRGIEKRKRSNSLPPFRDEDMKSKSGEAGIFGIDVGTLLSDMLTRTSKMIDESYKLFQKLDHIDAIIIVTAIICACVWIIAKFNLWSLFRLEDPLNDIEEKVIVEDQKPEVREPEVRKKRSTAPVVVEHVVEGQNRARKIRNHKRSQVKNRGPHRGMSGAKFDQYADNLIDNYGLNSQKVHDWFEKNNVDLAEWYYAYQEEDDYWDPTTGYAHGGWNPVEDFEPYGHWNGDDFEDVDDQLFLPAHDDDYEDLIRKGAAARRFGVPTGKRRVENAKIGNLKQFQNTIKDAIQRQDTELVALRKIVESMSIIQGQLDSKIDRLLKPKAVEVVDVKKIDGKKPVAAPVVDLVIEKITPTTPSDPKKIWRDKVAGFGEAEFKRWYRFTYNKKNSLERKLEFERNVKAIRPLPSKTESSDVVTDREAKMTGKQMYHVNVEKEHRIKKIGECHSNGVQMGWYAIYKTKSSSVIVIPKHFVTGSNGTISFYNSEKSKYTDMKSSEFVINEFFDMAVVKLPTVMEGYLPKVSLNSQSVVKFGNIRSTSLFVKRDEDWLVSPGETPAREPDSEGEAIYSCLSSPGDCGSIVWMDSGTPVGFHVGTNGPDAGNRWLFFSKVVVEFLEAVV